MVFPNQRKTFSMILRLGRFSSNHISLPTCVTSYTTVTNLSPEIPPCRCPKYINELAEKIINAQLKARGFGGARVSQDRIVSRVAKVTPQCVCIGCISFTSFGPG